jgi:hypothetical protein
MKVVTRADVNEINLRLEGLNKFGKQHRIGNRMIITGVLFSGMGAFIIKEDDIIGKSIMGTGALISSTGIILTLDSYRHLKIKKEK